MKYHHSTLRIHCVLLLVVSCSLSAEGGENVLAWANGVEPLPRGGWQAKQFLTTRMGQEKTKWMLRTGVEHGLIDHLETALYVNTGAGSQEGFHSVSLEGKYMFLTPFTNEVGAAVFVQGGFGPDLCYGQGRLLVQKNFLEDTLVYGLDLGLTGKTGCGQDQVSFEAATGLSYRIMRNWTAGFELLSENRIGGAERGAHLYVGPTLHYATQKWWLTLNTMFGVAETDTSAKSGTEILTRCIFGFNF